MDGLKMKYFVLNPTKDDPYGQASRQALREYALSICWVNPLLADDLQKWASDEETDKSEKNNKQIQIETKPCEKCAPYEDSSIMANFCYNCGRALR